MNMNDGSVNGYPPPPPPPIFNKLPKYENDHPPHAHIESVYKEIQGKGNTYCTKFLVLFCLKKMMHFTIAE